MTDVDLAYLLSLDYLYSFVDYSLTRSFKFSAEKFDLKRMEVLLHELDDPHKRYPVIHIAGTKGKGSISAMVASALSASGKKVGFYTSPHLHDFNERIQVSGQAISRKEFVELVDEIKPIVEKIEKLSTFEITTALGFLYFARRNVDIAVIEVGLGGRLDATNLVTPLVSVISSVSYDHMAVLGNTLSQITSEKAGIIKPGRPVVVAPQQKEAWQVIEKVALDANSRVVKVGDDYRYAAISHSLDGQSLMVWSAEEQPLVNKYVESSDRKSTFPMVLNIPLLGYHQVENAATAYAALQVATEEGINLSEDDVKQGFAEVFWPGRFEILRKDPPLIVDSAHNQDSALKLRLAIEDYIPGTPVVLLFGASEDKDIQGMFSVLLPRVERVITTQSIHPRAMDANLIVDIAHKFGRQATAILPIDLALGTALEIAGNKSAVVVAGSLFVSAAARECWQKMGQPVKMFEAQG
jgi:dihydrofolate synthase/folylpolyglutamate synthase